MNISFMTSEIPYLFIEVMKNSPSSLQAEKQALKKKKPGIITKPRRRSLTVGTDQLEDLEFQINFSPSVKLWKRCTQCAEKFHSLTDLRIHRLNIHENNIHPCVQCNDKFSCQSLLEDHLNKKHEIMDTEQLKAITLPSECQLLPEEEREELNVFQCKKCSKKFQEQKLLEEHISSNHVAEKTFIRFTCENCSEIFLVQHLLREAIIIQNRSKLGNHPNLSRPPLPPLGWEFF